jgi:predicted RNA-binding Zn-ribbon protein involved in translation (DUF1610 family)
MKNLKCSRCKVSVDVNDDYYYKICPKCHVKVQAQVIKRTELRKLNKDSRKDIKSLGLTKDKLPPILWSFGAYAKATSKFKNKPTYEDYLNELNHKYLELARTTSANKALKSRMMPYVNYNDLTGNNCIYYRLGKLAIKFKFQFACDESHVLNCENCKDWLANYESGVMFEGDRTGRDPIEEAEEKYLGKDMGITFDRTKEDLGIGKQDNKSKVQYPRETPNYDEGFNLWNPESEEDKKKKKKSLQDILAEYDEKHTE